MSTRQTECGPRGRRASSAARRRIRAGRQGACRQDAGSASSAVSAGRLSPCKKGALWGQGGSQIGSQIDCCRAFPFLLSARKPRKYSVYAEWSGLEPARLVSDRSSVRVRQPAPDAVGRPSGSRCGCALRLGSGFALGLRPEPAHDDHPRDPHERKRRERQQRNQQRCVPVVWPAWKPGAGEQVALELARVAQPRHVAPPSEPDERREREDAQGAQQLQQSGRQGSLRFDRADVLRAIYT